ncbi:MAG: TetR/AcrR family transcriptional regulator [Pseudomonadota bacterium]
MLEHGLGGASLRPLARAAGTSDRMLIYHFGNKRQLVIDVLNHIAQQYADALDAAVGEGRAESRKATVARILAETRKPEMERFLVLWWEIVAGSARDLPGYREAAEAVMDRMLDWLEKEMPADDPDPRGGARYLLTLIEGAQMLSVVGRPRIARDGLASSDL